MEKIPGNLPPEFIYAIRHNDTGLYSCGGTQPKWAKTPKTWAKGPLKNHLHLFVYSAYLFNSMLNWNRPNKDTFVEGRFIPKDFPYFNCEILEIKDLTVQKSFDAEEWFLCNVVHSKYKGKRWNDKQYYPFIKAFADEHRIEFD